MNDYFNAPDSPVDFTRATAAEIRAIFSSIASGFGLLPSRSAMLQGRVNFAVAGGTANALTATFDVPPDDYVEGASFRLKLSATNTGAATLNVNALGAKQILDASGAPLDGGELVTGQIQDFVYVGGSFRLPAAGPQGPQGPAGGPELRHGAGAPGAGLGSNDDFYIDTVALKVYGPKAAGAWGAGANMVGSDGTDGTDGADGNTLLSGAGNPAAGTGANGDFYINTTAWTIFGPKAGGAWPAGHALMDTSDLALTGTNMVNGNEIGFRDIPKSRTVSANFTLAATDRGSFIEYNDTGDTCTVPLNSSVAIAVGAVVQIVSTGSGALAIAREAGVTMKLVGSGVDADRSLAAGGVCALQKINTNTWLIFNSGGLT